MRNVHYMSLVHPGPMIAIRTPFPMPRWRKITNALTPVLKAHGVKKKELWSIDGLLPHPDAPFTEEEQIFAKRLDAAFKGDPDKLPTWWLYDWKDDRFVLVREPGKGSP